MDKSSGTKFVLILAIAGALKLAYTVIKQIVKVLARVIVYFGLYIPFFYMIIGCVLVGMRFFKFEVIDLNSIMFYIGLSLCLICSLIITIRTYSTRPISSVADGFRSEIERVKSKNKVQRPEPQEEIKADPILFVYHSVDHPELLIEEHNDRFVVWYDQGDGPLQFLRVEPKNDQ